MESAQKAQEGKEGKDVRTEKNKPVRDRHDEGGKKQTGSEEAKQRMKKRFLKDVAAAVMDSRDSMDAKTAWKLDTNKGLRTNEQPKKISSAKSLTDQAALQRRAKRFAAKKP